MAVHADMALQYHSVPPTIFLNAQTDENENLVRSAHTYYHGMHGLQRPVSMFEASVAQAHGTFRIPKEKGLDTLFHNNTNRQLLQLMQDPHHLATVQNWHFSHDLVTPAQEKQYVTERVIMVKSVWYGGPPPTGFGAILVQRLQCDGNASAWTCTWMIVLDTIFTELMNPSKSPQHWSQNDRLGKHFPVNVLYGNTDALHIHSKFLEYAKNKMIHENEWTQSSLFILDITYSRMPIFNGAHVFMLLDFTVYKEEIEHNIVKDLPLTVASDMVPFGQSQILKFASIAEVSGQFLGCRTEQGLWRSASVAANLRSAQSTIWRFRIDDARSKNSIIDCKMDSSTLQSLRESQVSLIQGCFVLMRINLQFLESSAMPIIIGITTPTVEYPSPDCSSMELWTCKSSSASALERGLLDTLSWEILSMFIVKFLPPRSFMAFLAVSRTSMVNITNQLYFSIVAMPTGHSSGTTFHPHCILDAEKSMDIQSWRKFLRSIVTPALLTYTIHFQHLKHPLIPSAQYHGSCMWMPEIPGSWIARHSDVLQNSEWNFSPIRAAEPFEYERLTKSILIQYTFTPEDCSIMVDMDEAEEGETYQNAYIASNSFVLFVLNAHTIATAKAYQQRELSIRNLADSECSRSLVALRKDLKEIWIPMQGKGTDLTFELACKFINTSSPVSRFALKKIFQRMNEGFFRMQAVLQHRNYLQSYFEEIGCEKANGSHGVLYFGPKCPTCQQDITNIHLHFHESPACQKAYTSELPSFDRKGLMPQKIVEMHLVITNTPIIHSFSALMTRVHCQRAQNGSFNLDTTFSDQLFDVHYIDPRLPDDLDAETRNRYFNNASTQVVFMTDLTPNHTSSGTKYLEIPINISNKLWDRVTSHVLCSMHDYTISEQSNQLAGMVVKVNLVAGPLGLNGFAFSSATNLLDNSLGVNITHGWSLAATEIVPIGFLDKSTMNKSNGCTPTLTRYIQHAPIRNQNGHGTYSNSVMHSVHMVRPHLMQTPVLHFYDEFNLLPAKKQKMWENLMRSIMDSHALKNCFKKRVLFANLETDTESDSSQELHDLASQHL